jgi:hypothetical protein
MLFSNAGNGITGQQILGRQAIHGQVNPPGGGGTIPATNTSGPVEHLECISNMCVIVPGPGTFECLLPNYPCTHYECVSSMCKEVPGPGTFECLTPNGPC